MQGLAWLQEVLVNVHPGPKMEDREKIIQDFRPDMLDWYSSVHNEDGFFTKRGIRVSGGGAEYQEVPLALYDKFKDGGIAGLLNGQEATYDYTYLGWGKGYYVCHNAPDWHDYQKNSILGKVPFSDTIGQDNIGSPGFEQWHGAGGAFCPFCKKKFREYLLNKYSSEGLGKLGIGRIETFDIAEYIIKEKGYPTDETILEDAIIREYIKFQYLSNLETWEDIVRAAKAKAAELGKSLPVYGNQWGLWGERPYSVILSRLVDVVWIEAGAQPFPEAHYLPSRTAMGPLTYKVGLASGLHRKPVWVWCEAQQEKKDVLKIVLAESQANGGVAILLLHQAMRQASTGGYDTLKEYADFLHRNRPLFLNRENVANVGLVYSIPTLFWRSFPALNLTGYWQKRCFSGIAAALEHSHIPYEVVIFGHPELWDDSEMLNRLSHYKALILPGVDCLSDRQSEALASFVEAGGRLIVSGRTGLRDEDCNKRPNPSISALDGRTIKIGEENLINFYRKIEARLVPDEADIRLFREAVLHALGEHRLLETNAPPCVSTNIWRLKDKTCVHLLNYGLDLAGHKCLPARNIQIRIRLPDNFQPSRTALVSLGRPQERELPFTRTGDGRVEMHVPEIETYSIAVLSGGRHGA